MPQHERGDNLGLSHFPCVGRAGPLLGHRDRGHDRPCANFFPAPGQLYPAWRLEPERSRRVSAADTLI
jgi:hypothetical protein